MKHQELISSIILSGLVVAIVIGAIDFPTQAVETSIGTTTTETYPILFTTTEDTTLTLYSTIQHSTPVVQDRTVTMVQTEKPNSTLQTILLTRTIDQTDTNSSFATSTLYYLSTEIAVDYIYVTRILYNTSTVNSTLIVESTHTDYQTSTQTAQTTLTKTASTTGVVIVTSTVYTTVTNST